MRYFRRSTRTGAGGLPPGGVLGVTGSDFLTPSPSFARGSRAWFALVVTVVLLVAGVTYVVRSPAAPAADTLPSVPVGYGDVVVTVGGVGRIVPASSPSSVVLASSAGATSGSGQGGGATAAPPDAVFARTTGSVSAVLVKPGERVVAGQPIAALDDAGAAAKVVQQLESDTAAARIELQRMLHPLTPADLSTLRLEVRRAEADLDTLRGGSAADRARAVRIATRNVQTAHRQLALVLHPRTGADLAAARAELRRAEADLDALTTPPPPPTLSALIAAQAAVNAARAKLTKLTSPPTAVTLSAARADVTKAQADLALLQQQDPPASPAEINAAQATLDAANARVAELQAPADPAEVAAAEADVRRAEADLDALQTPPARPTASSVAAAQQAVAAARKKVSFLLLPPAPADVAAARLEVARAESDLKTLRAGPRPAALAAARSAVTAARAHVARPTNPIDIDLARVHVQSAEAQLAEARRVQDLLTVRALSDGTVTSVMTEPGAPVDPTTPIAVVSNLGRMAADVDVSEFDAAQVRQGMQAVMSVDALGGKKYDGTVVYAAPTGTDNGGVVTFPVRVSLDTAEGPKAGMNVSVRIIVNERRHVIEVPLEAVSDVGDGEGTVKVVGSGGKVTRRTVELGLSNNKSVEVVDGLKAGERVVLPAGGGQSDE